MILPLFIALMALSVVVVLLGYLTGDEPYLTVGLFFFFLLSIVILTGNVEYETGSDRTGQFSFLNTTSVPNGTLTTFSFNESTTLEYASWHDTTSRRIGWGLAVITFIGTALSLYNTRKRRIEGE